MNTVFRLHLTDTQTGDLFCIGLFSNRKKAQNTAERYLESVKGFCEHPCTAEVKQMGCVGAITDTAYLAVGWNETSDGDETDIIEGRLCTDRIMAKQQMQTLQRTHPRARWTITQYEIDRCEWQDGFVRVEE